jgi:hypothetical protein
LAREKHSEANLLCDDEARILVGICDYLVPFPLLCDEALLPALRAESEGYLASELYSCKLGHESYPVGAS